MKIGSGKPVVGATLVVFAPTNSTKWGVSYLIYACSTTVTASKDTNVRINPPFASAIVFDRLESRRKWRDSSRPTDAFPKLKWQLVGADALVVARPHHQPIFIPLCGLRKAMVIPSAARNLKSMITIPDSRCRVYVVTKSKSSVGTLYVGFTL